MQVWNKEKSCGSIEFWPVFWRENFGKNFKKQEKCCYGATTEFVEVWWSFKTKTQWRRDQDRHGKEGVLCCCCKTSVVTIGIKGLWGLQGDSDELIKS